MTHRELMWRWMMVPGIAVGVVVGVLVDFHKALFNLLRAGIAAFAVCAVIGGLVLLVTFIEGVITGKGEQ